MNETRDFRTKSSHYLLTGLSICEVCGHSFIGHSIKVGAKTYAYYRCGTRAKNKSDCVNDYNPPQRGLEDAVWNLVLEKTNSADEFERDLRQAQRQEQESLEPKRQMIADIDAQLAESKKKSVSFAKALLSVDGDIADELRAQMDEHNRIQAQRKARREQLQAELDNVLYTEERVRAALRFRERLAKSGALIEVAEVDPSELEGAVPLRADQEVSDWAAIEITSRRSNSKRGLLELAGITVTVSKSGIAHVTGQVPVFEESISLSGLVCSGLL